MRLRRRVHARVPTSGDALMGRLRFGKLSSRKRTEKILSQTIDVTVIINGHSGFHSADKESLK